MLLTGDARGDVLLESLELAGLMSHGRCHVDLLKVQHHCSSHSTTQDFFERVTADRYVISGNGKHDIPHAAALGWLSAARTRQPYDVYLTNRVGILDNKKTLDTFLASEATHEPTHLGLGAAAMNGAQTLLERGRVQQYPITRCGRADQRWVRQAAQRDGPCEPRLADSAAADQAG